MEDSNNQATGEDIVRCLQIRVISVHVQTTMEPNYSAYTDRHSTLLITVITSTFVKTQLEEVSKTTYVSYNTLHHMLRINTAPIHFPHYSIWDNNPSEPKR